MAVSDGLSGQGALCTEGSLTLEKQAGGGAHRGLGPGAEQAL